MYLPGLTGVYVYTGNTSKSQREDNSGDKTYNVLGKMLRNTNSPTNILKCYKLMFNKRKHIAVNYF